MQLHVVCLQILNKNVINNLITIENLFVEK